MLHKRLTFGVLSNLIEFSSLFGEKDNVDAIGFLHFGDAENIDVV